MRRRGLWIECGTLVVLAAGSVNAQDPPYADSKPPPGTEPTPAQPSATTNPPPAFPPAPSSPPAQQVAPQPTPAEPAPVGTAPPAGQPGGAPPPAGQPPAQTPPGQPGALPQGYGYPPPQGYGYPPPQGYGYPPAEQEPPEPPLPEPFPVRDFSITLAPLHLFLLPMLELTGELRLVDHFGVAVLAGYGRSTAEDELGDEFTFDIYEVGGQANWYILKPFHSLHLGVEFDYLKITTDDLRHSTVSGVGVGLAVGPLVGYKVMAKGGFTLVAQGGVQYMAARAEVRDSSGETDSNEDSDFILLLNFNLGWSF